MPANLRPTTVPPVDLATLAEVLAIAPSKVAQIAVTGMTHASDQVRPGDLYAALPGARRHGAEFAAQAIAAGAAAVLTDPAGARMIADLRVPALVVADPRQAMGTLADIVYGQPSSELTIIGITGTAGKTSTAYLVESGLRAAGRVTGLIGTVETRLGERRVDSVRTTPEATDLHALYALALERGVTAVVMEVSSHALAMGRVGGVRFAVGGWTNFGSDHLDFHAGEQDYFAAKARLFDGRCDVEVLNADDPALELVRKPDTVTFSAAGSPDASWYAVDITGDSFGQRFTAVGPADVRVSAGVALPGRHNVANALLAIATLVAVGIDPQLAADGVADCPGVPGRLERVRPAEGVDASAAPDGRGLAADASVPVPLEAGRAGDGPIGVVDYAHKTDAIVAALTALRELATARRGRLICVLGAGGDRDRGKRPLMGAAAARGCDLLIITDDNPRTEDPATIRREVLAGVRDIPVEWVEIAGRRDAIAEAVRRAAPADVIALLGKGHERGQEIGDVVHPFDDRVELAAALARAQQVEQHAEVAR